MSISSEITRLQTLRNNIRTKLIDLGVISDSSASLNDCYTGINSIAKKTSQTYTPTTSNQTIASGQYLSGAQTISGDANLVAGNIKQGVSIFGVSGSHAGQKTEQSKTVTPTAGGFTVSPDSGKVLSSVIINGDADLVAGNVKKDVNIFGVTGTLESAKNPHSTTWDFSNRDERRLCVYDSTYAFVSNSSLNYLKYLPTDDSVWINGGFSESTSKMNVLNDTSSTTGMSSISNITSNGLTFTAGRSWAAILIPYFLKSGQTYSITYTRSGTNSGGYVWCDKHGKVVSTERVNVSGAGTTTWTFTAPTDGWLYWDICKSDAGAVLTLSNCSVAIS